MIRKTFSVIVVAVFLSVLSCSAIEGTELHNPIIDPPTFRSLAFRWIIEGDKDLNSTVLVQYRKKDAENWKFALPLTRIDGDVVDREHCPFKTGNLFSGSILELEPATRYEVQVKLLRPDGTYEKKAVEASTRTPEENFNPQKVLRLYPNNYPGEILKPAYTDLNEMLNKLTGGTLVLIHPGTYFGTYEFANGGSRDKPIILRGTPDGEAIFDGKGTEGKIFEVSGKNYIHFENITIRNGFTGIKGNDADGIVVKNCTIFDVHYGITSFTKTRNWVIANNHIKGRVDDWSDRDRVKDTFGTCTGVIVDGIGHVVCYNTVHDFWDCVTISNLEEPEPWYEPHNMCIDFYNNDLYNAADDCIETDFSYYNVRVWNNRITNSHTGISTQPVYGGPVYVFRNAIYNVKIPLKLHNWPSGLVIFNNTIVGSERAFWSDPIWQNAKIMNNLFLGASSYSVATGSPDERTILDYNGYYGVPGQEKMFKWSSDSGETWFRMSDLSEFYNRTGHEAHGKMVDYRIFNDIEMPVEGTTYSTPTIDLRLSGKGNAVDAGIYIPNIADEYNGSAPDLGCYEYDSTPPHYGQYENFIY